MSIPVYRLPTGVKCLSNKGKVYISGACGVVILDFASTIFRKGQWWVEVEVKERKRAQLTLLSSLGVWVLELVPAAAATYCCCYR